jgi:hypothetical protein
VTSRRDLLWWVTLIAVAVVMSIVGTVLAIAFVIFVAGAGS